MGDESLRQRWGKSAVLCFCLIVMLAALYVALAWAFLNPGPEPTGLAQHVDAALFETGVKSRVTSVLLNYRAYDTLLECFVLFVGVVAVLSMIPSSSGKNGPAVSPILSSLVRLLVPFMILIAGYLLWNGHSHAGGAFQAGAILGAAGVLLILTSSQLLSVFPRWVLSCGICLGPFFFLLIGLGAQGMGGNFLEYRRGPASVVIVALEVVSVFSIGLSLAGLFGGRRQEKPRKKAVRGMPAHSREAER